MDNPEHIATQLTMIEKCIAYSSFCEDFTNVDSSTLHHIAAKLDDANPTLTGTMQYLSQRAVGGRQGPTTLLVLKAFVAAVLFE